MVSNFFEKKDGKGNFEYQEKKCLITVNGITENKANVLLGRVEFDLSKYCGKIRQ